MAELVIRVGGGDAALLERVLAGAPATRPHRLVVDAHVAQASPRLSQAARRAGVPFLVDPQTYYLQDVQHSADPWARLPFATPAALTPAASRVRQFATLSLRGSWSTSWHTEPAP